MITTTHKYAVYAYQARGFIYDDKVAAAAIPLSFPNFGSGWTLYDETIVIFDNAKESSNDLARSGRARVDSIDSNSSASFLYDSRQSDRLYYSKINGPFSFMSWDSRLGSLHLVSDPFGQEKFYYFYDGVYALVTTDLAALLEHLRPKSRLDVVSLVYYLKYGATLPGQTLIDGVRFFECGSIVDWTIGSTPEVTRFFSPLCDAGPKDVTEDFLQTLVEQIDRSVIDNLSNQGNALLLSSGLDSSYIAATLSIYGLNSHVSAYTASFMEGGANEYTSAKRFTTQLGMTHHYVQYTQSDVLNSLVNVSRAASPPSTWTVATMDILCNRISSEGNTNLISGMGADEIFGGYWRFLECYKRIGILAQRRRKSVHDTFAQVVNHAPSAERYLFTGIPLFFSKTGLNDTLSREYANVTTSQHAMSFYLGCLQRKPTANMLELMVAHECNHRIPNLLIQAFDPIARSYGISMRYPYLSQSLVQSVCGLKPSDMFWVSKGRWKNKKTLRLLAGLRLTDEIMLQKPLAFTLPIIEVLQAPQIREYFLDSWGASKMHSLGLFRPEVKSRLYAFFTSSTESGQSQLSAEWEQAWVLFSLAQWFDYWGVT